MIIFLTINNLRLNGAILSGMIQVKGASVKSRWLAGFQYVDYMQLEVFQNASYPTRGVMRISLQQGPTAWFCPEKRTFHVSPEMHQTTMKHTHTFKRALMDAYICHSHTNTNNAHPLSERAIFSTCRCNHTHIQFNANAHTMHNRIRCANLGIRFRKHRTHQGGSLAWKILWFTLGTCQRP